MVLRIPLGVIRVLCTRLLLSLVLHSSNFYYPSNSHIEVLQPSDSPPKGIIGVWALAVSLAATKAISFDLFSTEYLDVSVPQVPFYTLIFTIK